MRTRGYFSKPKGVREQIVWGTLVYVLLHVHSLITVVYFVVIHLQPQVNVMHYVVSLVQSQINATVLCGFTGAFTK